MFTRLAVVWYGTLSFMDLILSDIPWDVWWHWRQSKVLHKVLCFSVLSGGWKAYHRLSEACVDAYEHQVHVLTRKVAPVGLCKSAPPPKKTLTVCI